MQLKSRNVRQHSGQPFTLQLHDLQIVRMRNRNLNINESADVVFVLVRVFSDPVSLLSIALSKNVFYVF